MKVEAITVPRNLMIFVAMFVIRYLLFLPFDLFFFSWLVFVSVVEEFCYAVSDD